MDVPKKILVEKDFDALLENLLAAKQALWVAYDSVNQSFYKFLDQNPDPDIRERYAEIAAGHPEETWTFNPELNKTVEEQREDEHKEDEELEESAEKSEYEQQNKGMNYVR